MPPRTYFVSEYEENLFQTRYRDPGSKTERTWEGVFDRVASEVANDADSRQRYRAAMRAGEFLPSSPQLWNYGADRRFPRNGSSCFTGRMGDTLESFRRADSDAEDVYVASGGFGLLLDSVRSRGCHIRHCSEGAMGSMCEGGPARRIEGTTGYITGSGRARGALMMQLSVWHPDAIEFILAKVPMPLGWLDDWPTNARARITGYGSEELIKAYSERYVNSKEWPLRRDVVKAVGAGTVAAAEQRGIVSTKNGRLVPMVEEWGEGLREANRYWDLPMQNCNMSIRITDDFMEAVVEDEPWVFGFYDMTPPKRGENPWTKTDCLGELQEYNDGKAFSVTEDMREAYLDEDAHPYRYAVVLTTWEGLKANLAPNQNQWRDTKYARFWNMMVQPTIGKFTGKIMARQVWSIICGSAWTSGDPGVVFSDTYERYQPVDSATYGPRLSNPCSEYVNSAGGSCNLASLNLRLAAGDGLSDADCLEDEDDWEWLRGQEEFWEYGERLTQYARTATEYINDAMEYNVAPVDYIHEMTSKHYRTVGIGMMGLAEALMLFHVKYGSTCAQKFAAWSMSTIALECWRTSFELAGKYAKPEGWSAERMERIFKRRADSAREMGIGDDHAAEWEILAGLAAGGIFATNTAVTSVAPTGTISQIAGWQMSRRFSNGVVTNMAVTSGIEPPFGWGVKRQDSSGSTSTAHDLWMTADHGGQPWMVTASEVTPDEHVLMQAAVCAFTCMSVSKTINLPEESSVEDIAHAYELAWQTGVPGTAVYRDKSKPMQVLSALECPSGECAVRIPELIIEDNNVSVEIGARAGVGGVQRG